MGLAQFALSHDRPWGQVAGSRLTVLTDVKAGKPRSHSTPRGLAAGPRESFTSLILRFLACKMGHVMASAGNRDVERSAQRLA